MATKQQVADAILNLTYGGLKEVASDLSRMIEDKDLWPKLETTEEFAELLYNWAEAQEGE